MPAGAGMGAGAAAAAGAEAAGWGTSNTQASPSFLLKREGPALPLKPTTA